MSQHYTKFCGHMSLRNFVMEGRIRVINIEIRRNFLVNPFNAYNRNLGYIVMMGGSSEDL